MKALPQLDNVAKKHGVKFVVPYLHLDPAHKGLLLLEAGSAEAVRDFLMEAGFVHFLDNQLYLTSPVAELMKGLDKVPTIYP